MYNALFLYITLVFFFLTSHLRFVANGRGCIKTAVIAK